MASYSVPALFRWMERYKAEITWHGETWEVSLSDPDLGSDQRFKTSTIAEAIALAREETGD